MFRFWAKRKLGGPSRTPSGRFIDNIDWWFWDGPSWPGLLTRESFHSLRTDALTAAEDSELSRLLVTNSIRGAKAGAGQDGRLAVLLSKVSGHLASRAAEHETAPFLERNFLENSSKAFRAYLNVLSYWGYGYSWDNISAPDLSRTTIVLHDNAPVCAVQDHLIRSIQGYPFRFVVDLPRANLVFDEIDGFIFSQSFIPQADGSLPPKIELTSRAEKLRNGLMS